MSPTNIGPLEPRIPDLAAALVLFTVCHAVMVRLLRRIDRVLQAREQATDGVDRQAAETRAEADAVREATLRLLADARHDAARIRQQARQEGAALVAEARAEALRECDALRAESTARIEADRAAAERELRPYVSALAHEVASRVLGEPIAPTSRTATAETR
ncbi:F0F1 ATP synthase subunit B family protein [Streptomyces sp. enrichment culture]|uniref:F0F1 ATP synthase subunit B family protein n=1 Tax=Streptomyces sp. enrichment culture TaxID=1795815 RepID=UPI003F542C13